MQTTEPPSRPRALRAEGPGRGVQTPARRGPSALQEARHVVPQRRQGLPGTDCGAQAASSSQATPVALNMDSKHLRKKIQALRQGKANFNTTFFFPPALWPPRSPLVGIMRLHYALTRPPQGKEYLLNHKNLFFLF